MQVRRGSAETLAILLGVGADATLAAMHGFTPLHLACWLRSYRLRQLWVFLFLGQSPGHSTGPGTVSWHLRVDTHERACGWQLVGGVSSQPEIVKMLIDARVPLNPRSKNLSTPLIFACWQVCPAGPPARLCPD